MEGWVLSGALLCALAVLTWQQSRMYSDMETLWRTTLARNPESSLAHNNLGGLLFQKGQVEAAIPHFRWVVQARADSSEAHTDLGLALLHCGKPQEALVHLRQALTIESNSPSALNNLAWALATYPDAAIRDGAQAVQLAERANQLCVEANPFFLGTLAAAYAEAGRFAEAVATAQRASALAAAWNNPEEVTLLKTHIELYQANTPFHEQRQVGAVASPAAP